VKHIHRSCLCCMKAFGHSAFGITNIWTSARAKQMAKLAALRSGSYDPASGTLRQASPDFSVYL
jgi:hypothetical protein